MKWPRAFQDEDELLELVPTDHRFIDDGGVLETFCNRVRRHSALGMLSPIDPDTAVAGHLVEDAA